MKFIAKVIKQKGIFYLLPYSNRVHYKLLLDIPIGDNVYNRKFLLNNEECWLICTFIERENNV